jgi:hypothetical protein
VQGRCFEIILLIESEVRRSVQERHLGEAGAHALPRELAARWKEHGPRRDFQRNSVTSLTCCPANTVATIATNPTPSVFIITASADLLTVSTCRTQTLKWNSRTRRTLISELFRCSLPQPGELE